MHIFLQLLEAIKNNKNFFHMLRTLQTLIFIQYFLTKFGFLWYTINSSFIGNGYETFIFAGKVW